MDVIIRQCPLQRLESNLLQDHVSVRIGQDLLLDSITALVAGIDQLVYGNSRLAGTVFKFAVPLFFGEKAAAIGNDQALVARTGLVYSREINFIQDPVAQGEPHATVPAKSSTDTRFGTRSPSWLNSGPPRSIADCWIVHSVLSSEFPSLPENDKSFTSSTNFLR